MSLHCMCCESIQIHGIISDEWISQIWSPTHLVIQVSIIQIILMSISENLSLPAENWECLGGWFTATCCICTWRMYSLTPERTQPVRSCPSAALSPPCFFLPLSLKGLFLSSCSHVLPSSPHFLSAILFSFSLSHTHTQLPSGRAALSLQDLTYKRWLASAHRSSKCFVRGVCG